MACCSHKPPWGRLWGCGILHLGARCVFCWLSCQQQEVTPTWRWRHSSRLMHPWAAQHHHPPHAQLQRDARSFGSTRCPTRPSSLPLGQGGSCQTKRADWEINDSPAKANNPAVLSDSHCFSPLPILLRGAQNKSPCWHHSERSFLHN